MTTEEKLAMAMKRPGVMSPIERLIYILALTTPGMYSVKALAMDFQVSETMIVASVRILGRRDHLVKAKPSDGFINLEALDV